MDTDADLDGDVDADADLDGDVDVDGGRDGDSAGDGDAEDASPDADPEGQVIPVEVTLTVNDDLDDGELEASGAFGDRGYAPQGERNCWTYLGGYDPTTYPGTGETVSFFRFALTEEIPPGATVVEARLALFGRDLWEWQPAEHTESVFFERTDDAAQVASIDDLPRGAEGGRALVPASVLWGVGGGEELLWQLDGWNESPDLSAPLQALVDEQAGLVEGAHVQLFLFRVGATSDGEVAAEDFCHPDGHQAKLWLRWAPPP